MEFRTPDAPFFGMERRRLVSRGDESIRRGGICDALVFLLSLLDKAFLSIIMTVFVVVFGWLRGRDLKEERKGEGVLLRRGLRGRQDPGVSKAIGLCLRRPFCFPFPYHSEECWHKEAMRVEEERQMMMIPLVLSSRGPPGGVARESRRSF